MALKFNCPKCGKETAATEQAPGEMVQCTRCGQTVAIPTDPSELLWTPDEDDGVADAVHKGEGKMSKPRGYTKVVLVSLIVFYPLFAAMAFVNWLAAPGWRTVYSDIYLLLPSVLLICCVFAVGTLKRKKWGWRGLFAGQAALAITLLIILPIESGIKAFLGVAVATFILFLIYKSEVEYLA